jgi:hypothetical protein
MPFVAGNSPPVVPGFDYFPALFLHQGESVDGDGVFPRTIAPMDGSFSS